MTAAEYMKGALHKALSDLKAKEFEFANNDVKIRFDLSSEETKLLLQALDSCSSENVAKEPEIADWSEVYEGALEEYRCPACRAHIDYCDNFCKECGQKLLWKEKKMVSTRDWDPKEVLPEKYPEEGEEE